MYKHFQKKRFNTLDGIIFKVWNTKVVNGNSDKKLLHFLINYSTYVLTLNNL